MKTVYFDLETGGLTLDRPNIQIAAVAVDAEWREVETFERKLLFDASSADPTALKMNSYNFEVWEKEAVQEHLALNDFSEFLKRHAPIEMRARATGKPYFVARLAGYNAVTFDGPRIKDRYQQLSMFLPAHPQVLCVLQRAQWWFIENPQVAKPPTMKLGDVCSAFGISAEGAHDAFVDVRMTVQLARRLATPTREAVAA